MHCLALLLDIVILGALYVAVAREEITREQTATDELWSRPLSYYTKRNPAGCDEPTGREIDAGNAPRRSNTTRALGPTQ